MPAVKARNDSGVVSHVAYIRNPLCPGAPTTTGMRSALGSVLICALYLHARVHFTWGGAGLSLPVYVRIRPLLQAWSGPPLLKISLTRKKKAAKSIKIVGKCYF